MDILDKHYGSHETTEAIYVRHKEIRDEMVKTPTWSLGLAPPSA